MDENGGSVLTGPLSLNQSLTIKINNMKKILLMFTLLAAWIAGMAQSRKAPKGLIADETTANATEKYYNVKTDNEQIAAIVLNANKKDSKMLRYTVIFKKDRMGTYPEYRFVYDVLDSMYVLRLFDEKVNSKH